MKSPLLIGTDVTNITRDALAVLTNRDAIAVNQDDLGRQAAVVWRSAATLPLSAAAASTPSYPPVPLQSVWAGPLARGGFTALLLNVAEVATPITLRWAMLAAAAEKASTVAPATELEMYDVWSKESLGVLTRAQAWKDTVGAHGVVFMTLRPRHPEPAARTAPRVPSLNSNLDGDLDGDNGNGNLDSDLNGTVVFSAGLAGVPNYRIPAIVQVRPPLR